MNRRAVARGWCLAALTAGILPSGVHAAAPQDPSTLRVVVTAEDSGEPMAGAVVSIPELGITVATDETGAVVIPSMPAGSFSVVVSSLGYASVESPVEVEGGSIALEVTLASTPIPLGAVVVEGQAAEINPALDRNGFYSRRAQGLGIFFDRAEIERANPRIPSDLIRGLPGVQSRQTGTTNYAIGNRRGFAGFDTLMVVREQALGFDCRMQVFVDGAAYGTPRPMSRDDNGRLNGDDGVLDSFPIESIEAIEVISAVSRLPMQYNVASANCGVILVWTRSFSVASSTANTAPLPAGTRVVEAGDDVRIASELASGRFRVDGAGPGGLTLQADPAAGPIDVPAAAITNLEVSIGKSVPSRRGLLIGGVSGTLVGAVFAARCYFPHYGCLGGVPAGANLLMGAGLGSIVGLVVSWASDEIWTGGRLPIGP
jgi:hypothetical protein